ncbi:MAG: hypothetical protein AAFU70_01775, partial [Planctomycetota bacterium]
TEDDSADGAGEDKMALAGRRVAEAKKSGKLPPGAEVDPGDPFAIASFYTARFKEDARRLGLRVAIESEKDPSLMPRATGHVASMIRQIAVLESKGMAYVAGSPGSRAVYFDVTRAKDYGSLSGNTLDRLRGGAGGRVSEADQSSKRQPADFLLWKEDQTHLMKWDSPWGVGYPGWHIECSAMSLERLDPEGSRGEIDLHTGGEDNIFPHHECERAQAAGVTGNETFARHWAHARFLMVNGEKMSKSRGNFFTPRGLMEDGHEPAAIRLELIKTHYRANADFSMHGLRDAARMIERWRRFLESARASEDAGTRDETAVRDFADALASDLNVAGALGVVNKWIGSVTAPTRADAAVLSEVIDPALGVLELGSGAPRSTDSGLCIWLHGLSPDPEIEALIEDRRRAKLEKDYPAADAIRETLFKQGLLIKDVTGGRVEIDRAGR